ncbi:MAG: nucleoside hydrolase [Pseudonocardiales bacterium]
MGEVRDDDTDTALAWSAMPPSLRDTLMIVDTDIGGDPDDALALVCAARVAQLALVITSDEHDGERARFARHLLDQLGRKDVPVLAGRQLGDAPCISIEGLTPVDVPAQPTDVLHAVATVLGGTTSPVRWVGMGPLSNLAAVFEARPDLASRLEIVQMGGALRYRDPDQAEHNFRLDPTAATTVLRTAHQPTLVLSDVTFTPEIELTADSPLYRQLTAHDAPVWARTVAAHLDQWFERFHPGSMQHDALTLSLGLELPFVDFYGERVALDNIGRMCAHPDGADVFLGGGALYEEFRWWLSKQLAITPIDDRTNLISPR